VANEVKILLTAIDRTSGPLKGIQGNVDKLTGSFNNITKSVGGMVTAAAGIGAAFATISAVKDAIKSTEALGQSVHDLNEQTGLSEEEASRMLFAFKHVGMEAKDAERSLGIFAKKLKGVSDAETGVVSGGKSTAQILADIGISATDSAGNVKPLMEILMPLADRFQAMPAGIEKTGLAMQLFGRSGRDMIEFLNLGSDGLTELGKTADKLGVTLSGENVRQIKAYSFAQRDLKQAITGLKVELTIGLLPALTKLIQAFTDLQPVARAASKVINENFLVEIAKNMGPAFGIMGQLTTSIVGLRDAFQGTPPTLDETTGALVDLGETIPTVTDEFKTQMDAVTGLTDSLKALDSALEGLAQQETTEEAALKKVSSALNAQIKWREAWVSGGGGLTDEQQAELENWKKQKEALDAQTEAIKASKDAVVANAEALQSGRPTLDAVTTQINNATSSYLDMGSAVQQTTDAVNSCSMAPIQTDLAGLASVADLAGDAAGRMVLAWKQALRDSTAVFQEIGHQIDEEVAHLQSLAPSISVPTPTVPAWVHPIPYQQGGTIWGKQMALVGERGPELVELPTGTRVHSNKETRKIQALQGGGIVGSRGLLDEYVGPFRYFQTPEAEGIPPDTGTAPPETALDKALHAIANWLPLGPIGKLLASRIDMRSLPDRGYGAAFLSAPGNFPQFQGVSTINVTPSLVENVADPSIWETPPHPWQQIIMIGRTIRHELTHAFVDWYHTIAETIDFIKLAKSGVLGTLQQYEDNSTTLSRIRALGVNDPQHVPTAFIDWLPINAKLGDLPEKLRPFFDGFLAYKQGGLVPGPLGKPQLGLLHGGEEVIPAGRRGEAMVNNLQMHVTINGTSEEALVKFERLFNDLLRRAGFGGSSISAGAFIPA